MASTIRSESAWDDEMAFSVDQLFFVTCYSDFDKLAHGPRGIEAKHSVHVYRFHPHDGSMLLLNICGPAGEVQNPAFSICHPRLNVVYTCTEDIVNNGKIFAYALGDNGELKPHGEPVDAGGTSTCYLTIDRAGINMLAVNYWDSTLAVIPLDHETGKLLGPIKSLYDPKAGGKVVAAGRVAGGVNHSNNDESTIKMRQADPHSHALVLDPYVGTIAYVPCLGKDLIREFFYNREDGKIEMELNALPSGLRSGMPDGPRYFEFHPNFNIAYCINELSATVTVFEVDRPLLYEMAQASADGHDMSKYKGKSTLRLVQSIKTIPNAFPTSMNTCGRICVHRSGRFVLVSNRGHQSIAIFKVFQKGAKRGELKTVGYFHTRGETPRHFNFDASGQYLLVANQDTNSVAIFNFNLSSGEIKYTGNEYRVPSPNFVCCCPLSGNVDDSGTLDNPVGNEVRVNDDNASATDSDSGSTLAVTPTKEDLMKELARARQEIAALKDELSVLKA
ncbi:hypothetical protein ACA910_006049 [Epithemia clementina (nom. ined.)]